MPIPAEDQRAKLEAALKEFNAQLKPLQEALAKLEEPHRRKLLDKKLANLPEDAQRAHRTPDDQRTAGQKELVAKTARQVGISASDLTNALSEPEKVQQRDLQARIKKLESQKPAMPIAIGIQDAKGPAPKTYLLARGELSNPSNEVHPGFPIILSSGQKTVPARVEAKSGSSTGRRTALANWIASDGNPLTSRVMVNRIWQHHFGRGIVPTTSDFGVHGEAPSHPELLDWLAFTFREGGWSIKQMHKLMLLSATYQQTSLVAPDILKKDPENRYVARMNRLRLEGEIIRDNLLAVSGRLNPKLGGPGVFPPIPAEALKGATGWIVSPDKQDHYRRSIYIFARRNLRFPFLETFDLPDSNLSCPKRERSTTAPQALALLNASDVIQAAEALAANVAKAATTDEDHVAMAYRMALGRRPSEVEAKIARRFLEKSPMSELCRAMFNLNEFVYLD